MQLFPNSVSCFSLIVIVNLQVMGQLSRTDGMIDLAHDMPNTLIQQIPFEPITTQGSYYYLEEWKEGQIELKNGMSITGFPLKYDIKNNEFILNVRSQIKVLNGSKINQFAIFDGEKFINFISAQTFTLDNLPFDGFFEVLVDGEQYKLLSKWSTKIKKATYNVALDMGTEENKIFKVETLYLAKKTSLYKLRKNKKRFLANFGDSAKIIEQYVRKHKLSFKKKEDLQKIVAFSNTL